MKQLLFIFSFLIGMSVFAQEIKTIKITKGDKHDTLNAELEDIFGYFSLQQQPEYPGGMSALMEYVSQNFILPKDYKGEKGKIVAEFVIEKNGEVQDVNIMKGITPSLDTEAIRVLKSMKGWKAGILEGKPVRVRYAIPINIK